MKKLYGLLALFFAFQFSWSQVSFTSTGSAYTQDFNTLAISGTTNVWTDNTTIAGWYSNRTVYLADAGTSTTGGLFSYGATGLTERALGALTSGSAATVQFGVRLVNNTGSPLTSLTVNFTGEQWRQNSGGAASAQLLVFDYQVGATTLTTGTWTPNTAFDFNAPKTTATGALDGNTATNQTVVNGMLTVTVLAGQEIWLRWTKTGSNSPGLAIDNVSITANAGATNSITTGAVATAPFCLDASTTATGTVAYTANGTYNTTFTAYLSDASGNFTTPVAVGSASVNGANPSGSINIAIPAGTVSGTGYKIRIDATSPAVTGSASAAFEIINGAKNVATATATGGNAQASVSWTNPSGCFDEILIVAKASVSVTATPSGNGSAYTASNVFGSGTLFDGGYVVYKGTASPQTVTGLTNGTLYYFKIFTRKGTTWSSGVEVSATPAASTQVSPGDVVINQLSPQYNATTDEYIELVNKTNNPINLSGYTIRYQSAAGNPTTGNLLVTLSGTILPRRYLLLATTPTVTVGQTNALAADIVYADGMATAAGQIALVRTNDNVVIDAVGYGAVTINTTSPYTETAAAPGTPTKGGLKRSPDGTDNNNNSTDFATVANAAIFLRSSGAGAPLPVKLTNFKAVQKGTAVQISWSNAIERDIRDYTVERSVNSVDFTPLVKMYPTGNLQSVADYLALDASPVKGANYYRIRSTETDGKTTFSGIIKLNTAGSAAGLLVYPNPVKGTVMMLQLSNMRAGTYTVRIIAIDGRVFASKMMAFTEGSSTEYLPVNNLPAGIYTLQLQGQAMSQHTFSKQ